MTDTGHPRTQERELERLTETRLHRVGQHRATYQGKACRSLPRPATVVGGNLRHDKWLELAGMPEDDPLPAACEACIANADELIRGGKNLAEAGIPRLAYHLAVLALEEVGKSSILAMQYVARKGGRELPGSIGKALDDHVRKLFWAIWGPSMGLELITKDQIESNIGLAQRLHDRRVAGLYVDANDAGLSIPMDVISAEKQIHCSASPKPASRSGGSSAGTGHSRPATAERREWFFEVTEDPERRALVFGSASMKKLKELGSVPIWVDWAKRTFDDNEAETRAILDRELERTPDDSEGTKAKWRTTIRLYTSSHSVRQKPLNRLNDGLLWTKLRSVSGKPDQLLIDLEAGGDLTLDRLYRTGLLMSRRLVMALNVATLGFFWFHEVLDKDPKQSGRFFERMTDLGTNMELRIHRNPPLRLEHGSRRVLDAADLNRWVLCFGHLLRFDKPIELNMCERYLDGLTMIAKSDAHMAFEIQSVAAFYIALKDAMKHFGGWADDEPFGVAMKRFAADALRTVDDEHFDRLIGVGDSVNSGRPVEHAMTMHDVGVMKAIVDVYLIRAFQRLGPGSAGADDDEK